MASQPYTLLGKYAVNLFYAHNDAHDIFIRSRQLPQFASWRH